MREAGGLGKISTMNDITGLIIIHFGILKRAWYLDIVTLALKKICALFESQNYRQGETKRKSFI